MNARFEPHIYADMLNTSGNHAVAGGLIHTWTGNHWSATSDDVAWKQAYRWIAQSEPHHTNAENAKKAVSCAKLWLPEVVKASKDIVIPCSNGYVQVKDGQLSLTSPDKLQGIRHSLICDFQPDFGTARQFEEFLRRSLPDEAVRARVQEYIGYTLTSDTRYQRAQLWLGNGANGKGVLANIVQKLHANIAAVSLDALDGFKTSALIGASLIYADEIPKGRIDERLIKQLIAGELTPIDRKYETPISARILGKWLVLGNHLPAITDHSIGFWRRWDIVPFHVTVKECERDPLLAENIIRDEISGVLNWALEGLLRLQKRGKFEVKVPLAMENILKDAKVETNSVQAWFEENEITTSHSQKTKKVVVYEHYREWSSRNGMASIAGPIFWKAIRCLTTFEEGRRREEGEPIRHCNLLLPK